MVTVEDVDIGSLFKKKKKKAPAPPPPPPTPAPPETALFTETQAAAKANTFPWLPVTLIGASVLVIGVSLFLILKKN
jgi:hypothetical protein